MKKSRSQKRNKSRNLLVNETLASRGPEVLPGLPFTSAIAEMIAVETSWSSSANQAYPPNPFLPGELVNFLDWLRAVSPKSVTGLPRYMEAVYNERADLKSAFPEVQLGELNRFAWWAYENGRFEVPSFRLFGNKVERNWKIIEGGRIPRGVDVIGFFTAEHGIGEAARLLYQAIATTDTSISTIGYRNTQSRQNVSFKTDDMGIYKTVITAVNAEQNWEIRKSSGSLYFQDTYVIGQWFWELETPPSWYEDAYEHVDELWAPTKFIAEMLRRNAPERVVVNHLPLPLRKPHVITNASRAVFNLDDRFIFLFTFDFMSVMKRKNPLGLIEAFRKAFSSGEGPVLVLKSINGKTRPAGLAALYLAAAGRDDIIIMDEYLDAIHSATLMNLCDCYVSLHRSEGLGLTIAEAMLLGKPVIATGYSGNLDFMTQDNSYLVPWVRVKVGEGAEAYETSATWAEPDLNAAAALMRQVYFNPDESKRVAMVGKLDLESRFTPEQTGEKMKNRLKQLWESPNEK